MKVVLISPYSDVTALGLRMISAVLRRAGHATRMIFLPHTPAELADGEEDRYPEGLLREVAERTRDADLVGIPLITAYFHKAVEVTRAIKAVHDVPVLWGGIHPTIRPRECLEFADLVCLGEGEGAVEELAGRMVAGSGIADLANVGLRANGSARVNPPRPLEQNLDALPFPDYSLEDHWIWERDGDALAPLNRDRFAAALAEGHISRIRDEIAYQTIATRGCPHNCSYCCNNVLRDLYRGQRYVRCRSQEHILGELEEIRERFPFVKVIGFSDDSFFAARESEIAEFAAAYRERIGLPFFCLGSPLTITAEKLRHLTDAGMFGLQMGIQTGSPRTLELYERHVSTERVLEAARLIHRFQDRMIPPSYDFIIDNPLESTEDILQTVELMLALPRPNRLQLFSLVVFPETGLYHEFHRRGLPVPETPADYNRDYHKRRATYLNLLFGLIRHGAPRPLIKLLAARPVVRAFERPGLARIYSALYSLARKLNRHVLKRK